MNREYFLSSLRLSGGIYLFSSLALSLSLMSLLLLALWPSQRPTGNRYRGCGEHESKRADTVNRVERDGGNNNPEMTAGIKKKRWKALELFFYLRPKNPLADLSR